MTSSTFLNQIGLGGFDLGYLLIGMTVTKIYRKKITVVLSLVLSVIVLFAISNCFTMS